MTTPESSNFDLSVWQTRLNAATKVVIAMFGAAYAIGLIILNVHVRQYGVNYLGFLQIEYVIVGILWGFLVGLTYTLVVALVIILRRGYEESKGQSIKAKLWKFLLTLFFSFGLWFSYASALVVLSEGQISYHPSTQGRVIVILLLNASVVAVLHKHMKGFDASFLKGGNAFNAFYYACSILVLISFYSYLVFPKLSPTFGGGLKRKAVFVVKSEQLDTVKAVGLESSMDQRSVGPLEVVFEASDFFLVKPPQNFVNAKVKAIRINKDLINATFYLADKPQ